MNEFTNVDMFMLGSLFASFLVALFVWAGKEIDIEEYR